MGGVVKTIFFSRFFLGLGKGIEYLKSEIQDKGDYLFHIGSEFSRSARSNGSGSDHGTNSAVHTLISNKINGNQILGEIGPTDKDDSSSDYYGSWGQANTAISLKKVHSTICDVIGVEHYFDEGSLEVTLKTEVSAMFESFRSGKIRKR